jgi:hypothetical protein
MSDKRTILAIDPGPILSSFVLIDHRPEMEFGTVPNEKLLPVLELGQAKEVVIEEIRSYGMPVGREVFDTCRWTGRFQQAAETSGSIVTFVGRIEIKTFWCKDSRAKDPNIRRALMDHYGAPGLKKAPGPTYGMKGGVWSAPAIAGYHQLNCEPSPCARNKRA